MTLYKRPTYYDLPISVEDSPEEVQLAFDSTAGDVLQLKYDGHWVQVSCDGGPTAKVFSRTGNLRTECAQPFHRAEYLGEYIFGTEWAETSPLKGQIVLFDILEFGDEKLLDKPYSFRYALLKRLQSTSSLPENCQVAPCFQKSIAGTIWRDLVMTEKVEGLILRDSQDSYHEALWRAKWKLQDDFVIVDVNPGKGKHYGRLGSVGVGLYVKGKLVKLMDVGGGFTDDEREWLWSRRSTLPGKVITVEGRARFRSGALRSPNFIAFRDDKHPFECVWKKT